VSGALHYVHGTHGEPYTVSTARAMGSRGEWWETLVWPKHVSNPLRLFRNQPLYAAYATDEGMAQVVHQVVLIMVRETSDWQASRTAIDQVREDFRARVRAGGSWSVGAYPKRGWDDLGGFLPQENRDAGVREQVWLMQANLTRQGALFPFERFTGDSLQDWVTRRERGGETERRARSEKALAAGMKDLEEGKHRNAERHLQRAIGEAEKPPVLADLLAQAVTWAGHNYREWGERGSPDKFPMAEASFVRVLKVREGSEDEPIVLQFLGGLPKRSGLMRE
jgi:hypothetical protein